MRATDFVATCLLGLGLLAAGWRDWRTLGRDRQRDYPGVDLVRREEGVQSGAGVEVLLREDFFLMVEGLADPEGPRGSAPFRHALGPATRLTLRSESAREAVVELRYLNGIEHQDLVFRYDGQPLEELHDQPQDKIERTFNLPLGPGGHVFQLEYARWNHHGDDPTPDDERPLAGTFEYWRVEFR